MKPYVRTPEQRADDERVRAFFRDKPSRQQLIDSGELIPGIASGAWRVVRHLREALIAQRESRGWSHADLASKLGVEVEQVKELETTHGINPTIEMLWRWAYMLDLNLDLVVSTKEQNEKHVERGNVVRAVES